MVFKVYKNIKNKLNDFKYCSSNLISLLVVKYCQRKLKQKAKEINKKIIDFIKYK